MEYYKDVPQCLEDERHDLLDWWLQYGATELQLVRGLQSSHGRDEIPR